MQETVSFKRTSEQLVLPNTIICVCVPTEDRKWAWLPATLYVRVSMVWIISFYSLYHKLQRRSVRWWTDFSPLAETRRFSTFVLNVHICMAATSPFHVKWNSNNPLLILSLLLLSQVDDSTGKTPTIPDGSAAPDCLHFLWQEDGVTSHQRERKKKIWGKEDGVTLYHHIYIYIKWDQHLLFWLKSYIWVWNCSLNVSPCSRLSV